MTEFETRLSEFREDFRKAALNGFIPYVIDYNCIDGYRANIRFLMECDGYPMDALVTVSDTFICHHEPLLEGVFRKEDVPALHKLIDKAENNDSVKEKKLRIRELKGEISRLEKEIEDGTKLPVAVPLSDCERDGDQAYQRGA